MGTASISFRFVSFYLHPLRCGKNLSVPNDHPDFSRWCDALHGKQDGEVSKIATGSLKLGISSNT